MRARTTEVLLFMLLAAGSAAQTLFTRHELSAGATYTRTNYFDPNFGGMTGRYTFNVRRDFALESSFTMYPQQLPQAGAQGGRSFTWLIGAKAGVRRQKWGLFGKAAPGLWHFTSVGQWRIPQPFDPAAVTVVKTGRTHFALELGGVFEFYPNAKWIIRTDVSEVLRRDGDDKIREIDTPSGVFVFSYNPGQIHSAISVSVGIGYRLGNVRESQPETGDGFRRFEAGAQYALSNISYDGGFEMMDNSGLGAWASYYLNRHFAIDASATHFWDRTNIVAAQMGGDFWQAVAGPKIGITREKFGAYAKIRPGIMRFANASNNEVALVVSEQFQPVTQFAIDMGGVLEFYPKRHWVVRMDLSDVTLRYAARRATYLFGPPFTWPSRWETTIQTGFGFGWRF